MSVRMGKLVSVAALLLAVCTRGSAHLKVEGDDKVVPLNIAFAQGGASPSAVGTGFVEVEQGSGSARGYKHKDNPAATKDVPGNGGNDGSAYSSRWRLWANSKSASMPLVPRL